MPLTGNIKKQIAKGVIKGSLHALGTGGVAYTVGIHFLQWLALVASAMITGIAAELGGILDKIFPPEDSQ